MRPSRIRQIESTVAAMMSTTTAPRHGARRLRPVIPIVMGLIRHPPDHWGSA